MNDEPMMEDETTIEFPVHENKYLDEIRGLNENHILEPAEMLKLVDFKIKRHMESNPFSSCDMCKVEVIN